MASQANNRIFYLHVAHFRFMGSVTDKLGPLVLSSSADRIGYGFGSLQVQKQVPSQSTVDTG
jgi:hypothetical protein